MLNKLITIFPNITSKEPAYISIAKAFERIKSGKSKTRVELVRTSKTTVEASENKKLLPSVCFSGKFKKERKDADLVEHSGFLILDLDHVEQIEETKQEMFNLPFAIASWISPSGTGVKVLVRIADTSKHKEHFESLRQDYPLIDRSGINQSRVCFESFDPKILIKETCEPYTKYKVIEVYKEQKPKPSGNDVFEKLIKWLTSKGDAFRTGERNNFLFKLASACCRFGMGETECHSNLVFSFLTSATDFSIQELDQLVKSAYRSNSALFGNAEFTTNGDKLIVKSTFKEVEIDSAIYDLEVKPKDVFFGEDVKEDALNILRFGYPKATPLYMGEMDNYFKWKRGEITCLTGIANMGKSSILKQLLLLQVICEGAKIGIYAPEDFPAHEYYHDMVELYIGTYCVPSSYNKPTEEFYLAVYDFISKHFFFVYPKDAMPTASYIKERFLELVIKRKIDFCIIDPFNQLAKGDLSNMQVDQYLEQILSELTKFGRDNNLNTVIVAHPNSNGLKKNEKGDFVRPDANNIAGGSMWYNKMDNILCYHRPFSKSEPSNTACELESIKIRRTKIVGKRGVCHFERNYQTQRFEVGNIDHIQQHIKRLTTGESDVIYEGNTMINTETGEITEVECPF